MLVLLIIFMIVTPLIAAGFQATIPRSANPENRPEGEGEVKLGIDKDGKFWLDLGSGPKQIPDDQLPERLQAVYETHTQDKILFLKADQNIERSEEHTSELQSQSNLVCRLLLEKKNKKNN